MPRMTPPLPREIADEMLKTADNLVGPQTEEETQELFERRLDYARTCALLSIAASLRQIAA